MQCLIGGVEIYSSFVNCEMCQLRSRPKASFYDDVLIEYFDDRQIIARKVLDSIRTEPDQNRLSFTQTKP